jgi:hypothetical protein
VEFNKVIVEKKLTIVPQSAEWLAEEENSKIQTDNMPEGGDQLGLVDDHIMEEGELIDSLSGSTTERKTIEDQEKTPILTQQSFILARALNATDMETEAEEMVDYKDEPANIEMAEMANLERSIEARASKLLEEQAIKIPLATEGVMESGAQHTSSSKSGDDSDEIDWDNVGNTLWSNSEKELTPVRERNRSNTALRRSNRIGGNTEKIQDKAEASKKKHNEFTGKNSSSFSILNSVDPRVLESIATISNINLGEN